MASSLYNQMNQTANNANDISNQISAIKNLTSSLQGKSSQEVMSQLAAMKNPQLAQAMNMIQGSGMSAKNFFLMAAQQRGIDPSAIVGMLK